VTLEKSGNHSSAITWHLGGEEFDGVGLRLFSKLRVVKRLGIISVQQRAEFKI